MKERRRFPRYDSALEVRYSTQGNATIESHTVTKNISRVGVRMPVSRIVKNGDIIDLDIKPPDNKAPVSAVGKVVWTRNITRPAFFELDAGVEFIKINSSDAERLLQSSY